VTFLVWTFLTPSGAAAPRFKFKDLGTLNGHSYANDINNYGQVSGDTSVGNDFHGFLWTPGTPNGTSGSMIDIGVVPGYSHSQAPGINDYGQVVGHSLGERAFLWTPTTPNASVGSMVVLGDLPGGINKAAAFGINASGQVVGYSATAAGEVAFLWSPIARNGASGTMTSLGDLNGGQTNSLGLKINASGSVTGYGHSEAGQRGFVWRPAVDNGSVGSMSDIGDLSESGSSVAGWSINNSGQIVGGSIRNGTADNRAFRWMPESSGGGGLMMYLGDLPGGRESSFANDINGLGWVVGASDAGDVEHITPRHAFLWTPEEGMMDLNHLVDDLDPGWVIASANAINDSGQIAADANYFVDGKLMMQRAVLLTPVPEPELMAGMSLAALTLLRRCRSYWVTPTRR